MYLIWGTPPPSIIMYIVYLNKVVVAQIYKYIYLYKYIGVKKYLFNGLPEIHFYFYNVKNKIQGLIMYL